MKEKEKVKLVVLHIVVGDCPPPLQRFQWPLFFFLADRQGDKFRIIAFESFANFELSI